MTTPTQLLAERLPKGLVHPGSGDQPAKLIPLPGLSSAGIPPHMAEQFAKDAGFPTSDVPQLLAEAIVHLFESEGYAIIPITELDDTIAAAATPNTGTAIQVHCVCDRTNPILTVATGRQKVTLSGPDLRDRINQICTCTATT